MISRKSFGLLTDATPVTSWTLVNENGLAAEVLDYGITLRSLCIPNRDGGVTDVVLGYDTLEEYVSSDGYLGATVGRLANRTKDASFVLNGRTYPLYPNDGKNHLHGGLRGFSSYVWDTRQEGEALVFSRISPHGEEGYPGTLRVQVTVGWEGNSLAFRYRAESDQDTPLNLTNHSYFNLNGAGTGNIDLHVAQICADRYGPTEADLIPTGQLLPVAGTAMDFCTPKAIGRDLDRDELCVKRFGGYDANYVLTGHPAATVVGDRTGITLTVDTDLPGLQFYTGNFLTRRAGKNRATYDLHSGFCLETQFFPDSVHHPQWPNCILRAGDIFRSYTTYTFSQTQDL